MTTDSLVVAEGAMIAGDINWSNSHHFQHQQTKLYNSLRHRISNAGNTKRLDEIS